MEHAKFWQEFFQIYKDLPALWRIKSAEYTDRVLKAKCYEQLVTKLKELYPDADREMVVKKINNYRTSYRKELRRIKGGKGTGQRQKPTLWYFNCLSFLHDQDEGMGEIPFYEEESTEENKINSQDGNTNNISTDNFVTNSYTSTKKNTVEQTLPSTSKRRKNARRQFKKPKQLSFEEKQQAKIDADVLAKSWAVQYKDLQGNQKLIARKIISDILFHGCLGTLNMSNTVDIQELLLKNASSTTQYFTVQSQSPIDSNRTYSFAEQGYLNYEESPLEFNNSSPPTSPTTNSGAELQACDIKFEVP